MNNPADTLAALAPCPFCGGADIRKSGDDFGWFQVFCGGCHATVEDDVPEKSIAAWNRRASLKGEAEPVAWMYEMDCGSLVAVKSKLDVPQGKAARPLIYGDTTPPAPQAVGEDTLSDAVAVLRELTGEHKTGMDDARADYLASVAKRILALTNPTPSPAPQGGGELRVRHIGGGLLALYRGDEQVREIGVTPGWDFRDRDEFIARYNATPPAQQPGEVGEVEIETLDFYIRRELSERKEGCIERVAALNRITAALAPKGKGNG